MSHCPDLQKGPQQWTLPYIVLNLNSARLLRVRCLLVMLCRIRYQVRTCWETSNSQPKPGQII